MRAEGRNRALLQGAAIEPHIVNRAAEVTLRDFAVRFPSDHLAIEQNPGDPAWNIVRRLFLSIDQKTHRVLSRVGGQGHVMPPISAKGAALQVNAVLSPGVKKDIDVPLAHCEMEHSLFPWTVAADEPLPIVLVDRRWVGLDEKSQGEALLRTEVAQRDVVIPSVELESAACLAGYQPSAENLPRVLPSDVASQAAG
jgi:hypothetical protein